MSTMSQTLRGRERETERGTERGTERERKGEQYQGQPGVSRNASIHVNKQPK